MKKQSGFTVVELIIFFVILITLAVVFVIQKSDVAARYDDERRKVAINSMYYNLTEVFYPANQFYPTSISRDNLKAIDPELFIDPTGFTLNGTACEYEDEDGETQTDGICDYTYEGLDCDGDGKCGRFKLTSIMDKEADFVKESPTK
jgi:type II secretory pathway pseudopilin PulG